MPHLHHHHEETTWKDGIFLKVVNIVVYFFFLGANVYALSRPTEGSFETYISPAPWAYWVWTLIHLLLFGTVIYQFFPAGKKIIIDGISWRFPLLAILNGIYVSLSAHNHYIGAFILVLFVSGAVTHIYYVVKKDHGPQSIYDELFVHLPFSLYHGWTAILAVVTTFEAFGLDASVEAPGTWTKVFVFLALLSLEMTSGSYAFGTTEGDLPGALAISFGLFAIFAHQTSDAFIHWTSLGFAILSLIGVLKASWGLRIKFSGGYVRITDEERGPLIGHGHGHH